MTTASVFDTCSTEFGGQGNDAVLECVSLYFQEAAAAETYNNTQWFFILAAALVFFMQAGFAMLCAGSVRVKNVQNSMMKNLLDACGAALGFFTVGYAFAFGGQDDSTKTTFIGYENFFMHGIDNLAFWLFQFAFAATSATIVAGTLAERCQMVAYLCYSMLMTGFVYPVVAHSIWSSNGFLSAANIDPFLDSGMIDFAGSGVVHVTGGFSALFATIVLGPRKGRFHDSRGNPLATPNPMPGHSPALQMLGTFVLWFGWYGFNPGSALTLGEGVNQGEVAAVAAVATTLSAASGCVTALFANLIIKERLYGEFEFDLLLAMNGALSGLVAITGGCGIVEPWAAVVIGILGGLLYLLSSHLLIKFRIDDAVDAIPVHLANGLWGVIAVGLFASPARLKAAFLTDKHVGWFYSWGRGSTDATLLAAQCCGALFILGWVVAIMFPFFIWLNYKGWFRSDSLEEMVGLDISYHGGSNLREDTVKSEYMDSFARRRSDVRRRRENSGPRSSRDRVNIPQVSGAGVEEEDEVGNVVMRNV